MEHLTIAAGQLIAAMTAIGVLQTRILDEFIVEIFGHSPEFARAMAHMLGPKTKSIVVDRSRAFGAGRIRRAIERGMVVVRELRGMTYLTQENVEELEQFLREL